METPKRSVFHRIGRRTSVFDRIHFSDRKVSVFERIGVPADHRVDVGVRVCRFWVQGRCTRNPCRFLHSNPPNFGLDEDELKPAAIFEKRGSDGGPKRKRPCTYDDVYDGDLKEVAEPELKRLNRGKQEPGCDYAVEPLNTQPAQLAEVANEVAKPPAEEAKPEPSEVAVTEVANPTTEVSESEEKCEISQPLLRSSCFSTVAEFQGLQNSITGIAFPAGLDKVFAGSSKDKTVRVWDFKSGNSVATIDLDGEVGFMLCEGAWIFVGITNSIRVWNTQRNEQFILHGVVGQVHAIAVAGDLVFAGLEDGKILSWRFDATTNSFSPASSLLGHTSSVLSLASGPNKLLFSSSADKTIRVWNVETTECRQILLGHSGRVTSLIAMHHNLVSCSSDGAIKAWAAASDGMFEIKYTRTESCGLLSLRWINDLEGKPVLLCSCNDNTVRAYDIPSFAERGKICSEEEVRCIQLAPAGMFFTGDAAGQVRVWKLLAPEATS